MSWDKRLYLQDAIDVRRDTVAATKEELRKKANTTVGFPWNYSPTENICRKSPGGILRFAQALASVENLRNKVGRENNIAATRLLHPYFSKKQGQFYPVDKERYRIGVGVSCQIKMLGLLHCGGSGTLYWTQYRKGGTLTKESVGLVATVGSTEYLKNPEYQGFGLKILDIGANDLGKRYLREYDIDDLRLWSIQECNEFFDPVFHAIRELKDEGFQPKIRERPLPSRPSDQPGLFD